MEFTLKTIHILAVCLTAVTITGVVLGNAAIATGALTALGALYAGNNIGKREAQREIDGDTDEDNF